MEWDLVSSDSDAQTNEYELKPLIIFLRILAVTVRLDIS